MTQTKQLAVLAGAVVVFVAATLIGLTLTFKAGPERTPEATCIDKTLAPGDVLSANLVAVNVRNTTPKAGLAHDVMRKLGARGFVGGAAGNDELDIKNVAIYGTSADDPVVALVAAQFPGKVEILAPETELPDGVTVLIGKKYKGLKKKASTKMKVAEPLTLCVPIVEVPEDS